MTEPDELATLEARLDNMTELARKHRVRPEMLAELHASSPPNSESQRNERRSSMRCGSTLHEAEARFDSAGAELSDKTPPRAKKFARDVSKHLDGLGMTGGTLDLVFTDAEHEGGLESVDYHIVTNPKYPAAPLARIASGGERSRISLAIQVVAAEKSKLPALILDEADVGIGGTTADVVGRLLRRLAAHTQVFA